VTPGTIPETPGNQPVTLAERLENAVDRMLGALADEAAALTSGSPDALLQTSAAKRRALQDLEALARDPRIPMLLDPRAAPALAQPLQDKLRRCRTLNLAAGGSITTARRDNEQFLRILGHSSEAPAYGATGQTASGARPRSLGRA
jgi:flagellar biosynthesis/type III secretory pathway chaperone